MNNIPKQIFFYWTGSKIPEEIKKNVENYKKINNDYQVEIIMDDNLFLDKAKYDFPSLTNLFNKISIPSCKSDIARLLILYYFGGIYVDCNTIPLKCFNDFYVTIKDKDFVISFNYNNLDYSTRVLFSSKESSVLKEILIKITNNLENLFNLEKESNINIEYNILLLTGTGPFNDVLGRNGDVDKFDDNSDIIKHYGCNMEHHHNKNFEKHWSNLQKKQKLFIV